MCRACKEFEASLLHLVGLISLVCMFRQIYYIISGDVRRTTSVYIDMNSHRHQGRFRGGDGEIRRENGETGEIRGQTCPV